ncbi:hypothetical protein [Solirubrobacter soli]|uniref:hypothetical protein n=1 Tax=Solirubrobacter soli TaxID=363832 RepID=UPI00041DCA97|nr:hypothetical protein [Solirubrobacter soli]
MSAFNTLERQLHDAAERRRKRHPALLLVPVAAAVALALLLVRPGDRRNDEREATPPVAAPAFVSVDPDKIVYVRATINVTNHTSGGDHHTSTVLEEWHRGRETHQIQRWKEDGQPPYAFDQITTVDGVIRQIDEEGGYRVIRGNTRDDAGRDAANVIADRQLGFLENFRQKMLKGRLVSRSSTFNGKPAFRYHIAPAPGQLPEGQVALPRDPDQSYYLDRTTGEPLGFTGTLDMGAGNRTTSVETIDTIKFLDPTPANLAKLRELTLKRRR